jgi:hypothetical protein
MTDAQPYRESLDAGARERAERAKSDDSERRIARNLSLGLPAATVVGAMGIGVVFGVGPALLTLAAGALVGVIALLWASLRTLGGDAPIAQGLVEAATTRTNVSYLRERKRMVLRALKDLELEHSVGKIDDLDYAEISGKYREQAKAILKELDVEVEPLRPKAEQIAAQFLKKKGLSPDAPKSTKVEAPPEVVAPRLECPRCATSNDPDAAFCKKCGAAFSSPAREAKNA